MERADCCMGRYIWLGSWGTPVNCGRAATVTDPALGCSGDSLEYALSGESCNLTREEHTWLKDCLYHYDVMIDSSEMLRYARERMARQYVLLHTKTLIFERVSPYIPVYTCMYRYIPLQARWSGFQICNIIL